MKLTNIVTIAALLLLAALGGYNFISLQQQPKIFYVRAEVVFNEFKMTKELKESYEGTQAARANILDSLMLEMKIADLKGNKERLSNLQREYLTKKNMFEEQNQELTNSYDEKVWLRINEYVKQYCQKAGYDILLATSTNGSFMYGGEKYDKTKELMEFMNAAYTGGTDLK